MDCGISRDEQSPPTRDVTGPQPIFGANPWTSRSAIASRSREGRVLRLASLFHRDGARVSLRILVILLLRREQRVSRASGRLPRLRRPLTAAVSAVRTTVAALMAASEQLLDILEDIPMDDYQVDGAGKEGPRSQYMRFWFRVKWKTRNGATHQQTIQGTEL